MKRILMTGILLFLGCMHLNLNAQNGVSVTLTGLEQVPEVRTPALGNVEVWVESDTLYVSGSFSDLKEYYRSAHIQFGEKGENGNRLFDLDADLSEDMRSGSFDPDKNRFYLRESVREALREGNLYINITSNSHQQGEIRGQLPRL